MTKTTFLEFLVLFFCFSQASFAKKQRSFSASTLEKLAQSLNRTTRATIAKDIVERAELLDRSGLYHLAEHERLRLLRENKISLRDLEKIGNTALTFDHVEELSSLMKDRGGNEVPSSVRLALAAKELRQGQVNLAGNYLPSDLSFLNQLAVGPTRLKGALVASGVYAAQGNMARALEALSIVPSAPQVGRLDTGVAQLQRARIVYTEGKLSEALDHLVQLPRSSASWHPGVLVGAWAAYRIKDYNLALGSLMTLHSPYLAAKFSPESHLLEAAALFRLCYFESAAHSLKTLREKYAHLISSLDRFRNQYGNRFSMISSLINYARGNKENGNSYPEGHWDLIADGLLSQEPMAEVDRSLLQIQDEKKIMDKVFSIAEDNRFNRALRIQYSQILEGARKETYRKGIKVATHRLASMRQEVSEALEGALAIEVEINTRIRERLISGRGARMKDVNFEAEIKKGYEFWPFEGEYWRDETGAYAFATSDVCGEQGS